MTLAEKLARELWYYAPENEIQYRIKSMEEILRNCKDLDPQTICGEFVKFHMIGEALEFHSKPENQIGFLKAINKALE